MKRRRVADDGSAATSLPNSELRATPPVPRPELATGWVHEGTPRPRFHVTARSVPCAEATQPQFWAELAEGTGVHCGDAARWADSSSPLRPSEWRGLSQRQAELREEGYSRLPAAARPEEAAALAAAVATLVRHGWHPLWCLVFDEAWTWLSRMRGVLAALVPGARPNCDFMAWYIDPVKSERGWVPHRDRRNMPVPDGAQEGVEYATVWLALTEATPLNSCMHVLPADMDRAYRAGELVTSAHDDDAVGSWVQDLRALPCQPAEALIWTGRLLHYGGRSCRRAPTPRISIACAVSQPSFEDPEMRLPGLWPDTRSAAAPDDTPGEEAAAPSPMRMPTLLERLRVIVVQLLQYDGPLESRAVICQRQRELVHALDAAMEAGVA